MLATVTGSVVYDFDSDGFQGASEPGLEGWLVFVDSNGDTIYNQGEPTAITGTDGTYSLEDIPAGPHVVGIQPQAGWTRTYPPNVGRYTVVLTADQIETDIDFSFSRDFTPLEPGNILVSRSSFAESDFIFEFTPAGELVQAIPVPGSEGLSRITAKDLVIDSRGRIQLFNGYDDVRLTTFDSATQTFTDTVVDPPWDMGRTFNEWGDIAAIGDYVFANEHVDDLGTANGIIRFNVSDLTYERFSAGISRPTELTVGRDGLLYVLNATGSNTTIQAFDPATMAAISTRNIAERWHSVAVDAQGELFAITDTDLKHYDADLSLIKSLKGEFPAIQVTGRDIVLGENGQLLLTNNQRVEITDVAFGSFGSFLLPGDQGINFTGYSAFVQEPVSLVGGGGGVIDYGILTPGNILVSNSPATGGAPTVYEYTVQGVLVRELTGLPVYEPGGARDLVTDSNGNVQIFNGTFQPRLTEYDTSAGGYTPDERLTEGWSTAAQRTFGGLASWGPYVYATDMITGYDDAGQTGLVRYDTTTGQFERFEASRGNLIDVTVGLDGLLYTLSMSANQASRTVRQYHPESMQLLRSMTVAGSFRAIAVDGNGDLFTVGQDIRRLTSTGLATGDVLHNHGMDLFSDVDIDLDGRLLVASQDGGILLTTRDLASAVTFTTRDSDGQNFAAFVSPTRGFPKALGDAFTVQEDSQNNPLDVLANDEHRGLGLPSVLSVTQGTSGGAVQLLGNTLVDYTPPAGFIGVDTFTYTLADGTGGSDVAVVQVTVEGNASFYAYDDHYSTVEDTPLSVLSTWGILANDGALNLFPVLGQNNILVAHSPLSLGAPPILQEYTRFGQLVRTITLPDFSGGYGDVRDLVVDRNGDVQIFNGTLNPRLTTYDPDTGSLTHQTFANWNTSNGLTQGGMAAWRNYVFATDQEVGNDSPNVHAGIVRYDVYTGQFTRFVNDGDFIDLSIGLDGMLYALGPADATSTRYVRVFDPANMQQLYEVTGLPSDLVAIAVNRNSEIYGVRSTNPNIYHYDATGALQRTYNTGLGIEANFSDLDLHENGWDLLVSNINFTDGDPGDTDLLLTNTGFFFSTRLQAPDVPSDMKFAAWVQAPFGTVTLPFSVASTTVPQHGVLATANDGSFDYYPDENYVGTDQFSYVVRDGQGSQRHATVSLTITAVNDRPELTPADPAVTRDEDQVVTIPLSAIINNGAGTTTITDPDVNDRIGGIAVTAVSGPGAWAYSLNGTTFTALSLVSDESALLLPQNAILRFTPAGGAGGAATITYHAWDATSGAAGSKVDTDFLYCELGGIQDIDGICQPENVPPIEDIYGWFSLDQDTFTLNLTDLNDAPILSPSGPAMGVTDEETVFTTTIGSFVSGVSDPDGAVGLQGVAITGVTGAAGGEWTYSLDDVFYYPLSDVSPQQARLLEPDDFVRYTPDGLNGELPVLTYRAWDKSDGLTPGTQADVRINGGSTAYSAAADQATLTVTSVNDAPVLTPSQPALGQTDVETAVTFTVGGFVGGVTDVDHNAVLGGAAITALTGQGVWSYSVAGGPWNAMPALTGANGVLLGASDRVQYAPGGGSPHTATITYRAWDKTSGTVGQLVTIGATGGTSAYSTATDAATLTLTEVNDPPTMTGFAVPQSYVENAAPISVFPGAVVDDEDSIDFGGGSLAVWIPSGGTSHDRLAIRSQAPITVSGGQVLYDGGGGAVAIGSLQIANNTLTVSFNTAATPAVVTALARAVTFHNVSENPAQTNRIVLARLVDGDGGTESVQVTQTITVTAENDPPYPASDNYSVFTGQDLTVTALDGVLANDVDVEGNPLTARVSTPPSVGTLTLNSNGSFIYEPAAFYYGLVTFSYIANDGQLDSDPVTVGISVLLPSRNPGHAVDVNADGYLSPVDALLIANDLDRSGGSHPTGNPPPVPPFLDYDGSGTVNATDLNAVADEINATGARLLPEPRFVFPQSPPIIGAGDVARIRLATADAQHNVLTEIPAGQPFYVEVWAADLRSVDPQGVFAAFVDIAFDSGLATVAGGIEFGADFQDYHVGDTATAGRIQGAGGGRRTELPGVEERLLFRVPFTAQARGNLNLVPTPSADSPADDVLLFGIDGPVPVENVAFEGTTVAVTGPPVAANDNYSVAEDGTLTKSAADGVLKNDDDAEHDPLSAVLDSGPQHGSLALNSDGSFTYQPEENFFGSDQFTYRAHDGFFDSNLATVAITVTGSNDDPVAVDDLGYVVVRNQVLNIAVGQGVLANDSDVDGDDLQASVSQDAQHGTLTLRTDGSFDYVPDTDFGGLDTFYYTVSDGQGGMATGRADINVLFGWQNPTHAVDANGDGFASPLDAVLVLNETARVGGSRVLPNPPTPEDSAPPFFDYNGSGAVSLTDAAEIVNNLNTNGARQLPEPRLNLPQTPPTLPDGNLVGLRLAATDAAGDPITEIGLGDSFFVDVYAKDLRSNYRGVFSAYLDLTFSSSGLAVAGDLVYGTQFVNLKTGDAATPGLLNEAGAAGSTQAPLDQELLLFRVPMTAQQAGVQTISANPADTLPQSEVTLLGIDGAIPSNRVVFGSTAIEVIESDGDADGVRDQVEDAGPNGGDGNDDGIPDSQQANVASFPSPQNGLYMTLVAPQGTQLSNVQSTTTPPAPNPPTGVDFQWGFFEFQVTGMATGGTANVTVYLQAGGIANSLYVFGPRPGLIDAWYAFAANGTTGGTIFADRIQLQLRDGGRGDDDVTANGIITHQPAFGAVAVPWQNPVMHEDVNNDGLASALDALTLINRINAGLGGTLPLMPQGTDSLPFYWDPSGNNILSAQDVLNVINLLNTQTGSMPASEPEGESFDGLAGVANFVDRLEPVAGYATDRTPAVAEPPPLDKDSSDTPDRWRVSVADPALQAADPQSSALPSLAESLEDAIGEFAEDVAGVWQSP